jgi:hypothetical protein
MVVHVVQWPIFASPERIGSVSSCSVRRGESEDLQLVSTGRDVSSSIMKDDESITCRGEGEKRREERKRKFSGKSGKRSRDHSNKLCKHQM